ARLHDEELEVAVADGEKRLPVLIRPGHGGRATAQPGDLGLVERREGDGLEVVLGHALVFPCGMDGKALPAAWTARKRGAFVRHDECPPFHVRAKEFEPATA